MNTTLAQAFPHIAAQIDAERVLLARPIAEHTTCDWSEKEIILHCDDDATYQLLTTPSQSAYLRTTFSLPIHAMRKLPNEAELPLAHPAQPPKPKRTANTLNFLERQALQKWMEKPDNAHFVAHESDVDAARQATQDLQLEFHDDPKDPSNRVQTHPDLIITAGNIASMRRLLRIEKIKPEKPAPVLPEGTTLADLQAQVTLLRSRVEHNTAEIDALRASGTGADATIASLHHVLSTVVKYLNGCFHGDTEVAAVPELPPLHQSGPAGQ